MYERALIEGDARYLMKGNAGGKKWTLKLGKYRGKLYICAGRALIEGDARRLNRENITFWRRTSPLKNYEDHIWRPSEVVRTWSTILSPVFWWVVLIRGSEVIMSLVSLFREDLPCNLVSCPHSGGKNRS